MRLIVTALLAAACTSTEEDTSSDDDLFGPGFEDDTGQPEDTGGGGEGDGNPYADVSCDGALVPLVEVRDSGGACEICQGGDEIQLVGVVYNPCDEDLVFEAYTTFLVSGLDLVDLDSGMGMGMGMIRDYEPGTETATPVAPGEHIEEVVEAWAMDGARYRLTMTFTDAEGSEAHAAFEVTPRDSGEDTGGGGGDPGEPFDEDEPPPAG